MATASQIHRKLALLQEYISLPFYANYRFYPYIRFEPSLLDRRILSPGTLRSSPHV